MAEGAMAGCDADRQRAIRLFYAVRDGVRYTPWVEAYRPELNRAGHTAGTREGYCVQKAALLVAMARYAGIPSRLGLADIINHRLDGRLAEVLSGRQIICHGFAELHLDGSWVKATPAFDVEVSRRQGIPVVDFDGRTDAILPARDLAGGDFAQYVKYHGSFDDVPFDFIMDQWHRHYPVLRDLIDGPGVPAGG